jgi:SAM-dependent methyltransferase
MEPGTDLSPPAGVTRRPPPGQETPPPQAAAGTWEDRGLAETRAFFAPRARGWEERFPDDGPAFDAAVAELAPPEGGVVVDAGCGTGRALPALRAAVGEEGFVVALDATPEMLEEAARQGRRTLGSLMVGDARRLPLRDASVEAVLAAGLLPHLDDPSRGLTELARVTRPGGRLALFHPIGRAALAARHGDVPHPDDVRAEPAIRKLLSATGWETELVDDGEDRYLVVARRL